MKTLSSLTKTFICIAILAVGFWSIPLATHAKTIKINVLGYPTSSPKSEVVEENPEPVITGISPDEVKAGAGAKTITVIGNGFTPSSIVKINGSNRPTTFIASTHLLAQANAYDFYRTDEGFYVTVWNTDQDYSNAAFVKVTGTAPAPAKQSNNNPNQNQNYGGQNNQGNYPANYGNDGYNPNTINYYPGTLDNAQDNTNLASSVILGGNSFLPNGLVQWVLVAILIVGIIVLGRKVFLTREHYDSTPLKHA